jgi:amidohydrolase
MIGGTATPQVSSQSVQNNQGTARDQQIALLVEAMRTAMVAQRRDFHMHPELSNREERTSRVVAEKLRALGMDEVKTGVAKYGVVAILKGGRPGPVVAIRADMDALPIEETIPVPYKSQNPGVKHACGHDLHMTIGLGVAEVLSKMRANLPGTVKFLFQPAEEGAPPGEVGGAGVMIKEGHSRIRRRKLSSGFTSCPISKSEALATIQARRWPRQTAFSIIVRGKKVHGAYPHDGIDTIVVASECVTALQTIRSRRINTMEPLVITIGSFIGGNRFNIIADEVKLEGTMRTLNEDVRKRAQEMMKETLAGITSAYGATFEIQWGENNPVTYNDPALVEASLPSMRRVLGADRITSPRPQMGAEDFSKYQKVIPGFFYFLGVGNRAKGIEAMIHTPDFDADEDALGIGVRVMSAVVLDYLDRQKTATR